MAGDFLGDNKKDIKNEIKGIFDKAANKNVREHFVVGLDLADEFSQVSFYNLSQEKPETLSMIVGEDQICIPTVLTKRKGENIWSFGREAVALYESQEGVLVSDLVSKAHSGDLVEVEHKEYDPVDLLTLYIKKCLSLVSISAPLEKVSLIMMTVNEPDARMIEVLNKAVETLRIKPEKVFYQSHTESAFYYMLHQNKDLWNHDVLILHLTKEGLMARSMRKNIKTSPVVVLMEERRFANFCYEDMEQAGAGRKQRRDAELKSILYGFMEGKLYSAVYLLGDGFDGDWCPESLKYMCHNRRVFRGNNLFSQGACYGAAEKIEPSELAKKYIFLGKDKVKANIGMKVYRDGEEIYMALLDAGQNWYDTCRETDLILDREDTIKLIITPLNGINKRDAHIYLTGLPVRPPRATRIHLELKMLSEKRLFVRVTDLGFGEFFPATNMQWTGELEVY